MFQRQTWVEESNDRKRGLQRMIQRYTRIGSNIVNEREIDRERGREYNMRVRKGDNRKDVY